MKHITTERWLQCKWVWDWRLFLHPGDELACEVGIGPLDISMLPWFDGQGLKLIGVEPHPVMMERAKAFDWEEASYPLFHQVAIGPERDQGILTDNGGSSALADQWHPTRGSGQIQVEVAPFSDIDPGNIDIINIDCEGSEHFVLQQMVSKPRVIGIELFPEHPKRTWCLEWLISRGYQLALTTGPYGETMVWKQER